MSRKKTWAHRLPSLSEDPTHPAQICLRTYALALTFSLAPSLLPISKAFLGRSKKSPYAILARTLARELHPTGFAFAVTATIGGGAYLKAIFQTPKTDEPELVQRLRLYLTRLSSAQKTFICYLATSSIGFQLLQSARRRVQVAPLRPAPPKTLDLTLLLLVRAVDVLIQSYVFKRSMDPSVMLLRRLKPQELSPQGNSLFPDIEAVHERLEKEEQRMEEEERSARREDLRTKIDAFLFWGCCTRIMWCFFFQPHRLPPTYLKWIAALAELDNRLLQALRLIKTGEWSYRSGSAHHQQLLTDYAASLKYPSAWGDPSILPAFGGPSATAIWHSIGVIGRDGVGGVPCELVHGTVGTGIGLAGSCTANATLRGLRSFVRAMGIYLPAHFVPILLTRPNTLLDRNRVVKTILASMRSASFLSAFVSSFYYAVCLTRTLIMARVFPSVSHDTWDSVGSVLAGCITCGTSIWIENGRRRGEMALYVLPKAVRSCLPLRWLSNGHRAVRIIERVTFTLSMSILLTAAMHHPDALRGLSRWTLAFIIKGPNAGFWRTKKSDDSTPATPLVPPTPYGTMSTNTQVGTPLPAAMP